MTAPKRRIALIARADASRRELGRYLEAAGFDVLECEDLEVASGFAALVVISAQESSAEALVANVRTWLRASRSSRILVVTSRPTALRELAADHAERVHVLPAPAFGWDVVDALRWQPPPRPKSA
ncbi:MAG TPA: hypothetical protein VIV58_12665 [Kofleriaceae bacterium]